MTSIGTTHTHTSVAAFRYAVNARRGSVGHIAVKSSTVEPELLGITVAVFLVTQRLRV